MGVIHPDHLKRVLTPRQIAEWRIYRAMMPSRTRRLEITLARFAFLISSAFGGRARPGKFIKDFCVDWDEAVRELPAKRKQTANEVWAILNQIPGG